MTRLTVLTSLVLLLAACSSMAEDEGPAVVFEEGLDVKIDGVTWLRTLTTPFDAARAGDTYKVYTHLYDFEGVAPITKGAGGRYPHHRGLFIGWNHTHVAGNVVDTWHMRASRSGEGRDAFSSQEFVEWVEQTGEGDVATVTARIHWGVVGENPFIEELRTLRAFTPAENLRAVDFVSTLRSLSGDIPLRGDPHHAGMQVRMAQEVVDNESETLFILPEDAAEVGNDVVENAWWACASVSVGGQRYWVLHMTSPALVTGVPQYSMRPYGRFGAFFEPDLAQGEPLEMAFRVIWSATPLDREQCEALFQEFKASEMSDTP